MNIIKQIKIISTNVDNAEQHEAQVNKFLESLDTLPSSNDIQTHINSGHGGYCKYQRDTARIITVIKHK